MSLVMTEGGEVRYDIIFVAVIVVIALIVLLVTVILFIKRRSEIGDKREALVQSSRDWSNRLR